MNFLVVKRLHGTSATSFSDSTQRAGGDRFEKSPKSVISAIQLISNSMSPKKYWSGHFKKSFFKFNKNITLAIGGRLRNHSDQLGAVLRF